MTCDTSDYESFTRVGEDIGVGRGGRDDWYVLDLTGDRAAPIMYPAVRSKDVAIQKALRRIEQGDYRAMGQSVEDQMARGLSPAWAPGGAAETHERWVITTVQAELMKRHANARATADYTAGPKSQRARMRLRADVLEEVLALIARTDAATA